VVTLRYATRSAQITRELSSSVIRRFETGEPYTLYGYATHYTLLLRKNSSHTTHCYIGTQHGDGGAGTPGRAGRVGLMCWGETEGMRTRDGQQQLPMSHTQGKDTSKALLDTDMYIDVDSSQTRCSRGDRWPW
jgi:hypothetical protein